MKTTIMGCHIDNLSMEETLLAIDQFIISGQPHQHVVVNVDKLVKASRDPQIREIINGCDLVNVDGMPVVWASRLLGRPLKERVAGVDLFYKLIARAEEKRWRVYLLGAKDSVLRKTIEVLKATHPNLIIAGHRNGYWTDSEESATVNDIREARADLLFVAISSPKKEIFLGKYQKLMQVPFSMGVGGTFDVVAGLTKRAPKWMQSSGLEWFYRFLQEPRRMFRRYFIEDTHFFWLLIKEVFSRPRNGQTEAGQ